MTMTRPDELYAGVYWARRVVGENRAWAIVCIIGNQPFLDGFAFIVPDLNQLIASDGGRYYARRYDPYETFEFRAGEWEFGPRIDPPTENDHES
jgi:hypothetical protein